MLEYNESRVARMLRRGLDETVIRKAIDLKEQDTQEELDLVIDILEEAAEARDLREWLNAPAAEGNMSVLEARLSEVGGNYAASFNTAKAVFKDEQAIVEQEKRRQELAPHNPFVRR